MIQITIERERFFGWDNRWHEARTDVRAFDDDATAVDWFVSDSYFEEEYVRKATWERIDD